MSDNRSAFHSQEYDEKIKRTVPYYDEFYKQIVSVVKAQISTPLSWLDVGCGTGRMAQEAFQYMAIERFVFCDNSREMLEMAKERYRDPRSEFRELSVLELKETDCFDVITAIQVLHYLQYEERITAIKNCLNALRKDGIFLYFENFRPGSEACLNLSLQRWKAYQVSQGKSPEEAEKHIKRYGKEYFPITVKEHRNILADCGFRYHEVIWLSHLQVGLMGIK